MADDTNVLHHLRRIPRLLGRRAAHEIWTAGTACAPLPPMPYSRPQPPPPSHILVTGTSTAT